MHERNSIVPAGRFRNRPTGDHKSWNFGEQRTRKVKATTFVSPAEELNCVPRGIFGRYTTFRSPSSGSSFPFFNPSLSSQIYSSAQNHISWWKNPVHLPRKESPEVNFRSYDKHGNHGQEFGKSSTAKRCNWIGHGSDPVYVAFHDKQWGVPIYDENSLFEMLVLSGMLSEYTWTEILANRGVYRDAFFGYEPSIISMMDERKISSMDIVRKAVLSESRVRCIINNSKCVLKIEEEHRSFSTYMWRFINYTPIINTYKYPRNIPLKTSKAMTISSDLVRRGFRFVGPTIIHTFMQAAGMTIDHLVDCFRYEECLKIAESPWGLLHMHFNF
ncbi:uncharacterized protein LOC116251232 [Nymphaea colorata]|nr:uncharacterized protein LOC116251232 [Nymphaea colorata]